MQIPIVILIGALSFQLHGCHSYRELPVNVDPITGQQNAEEMNQAVTNLIGNNVKIALKDGRYIKGKLIGYDNPILQIQMPWFILEKRTDNIERTERIDITDIMSISPKKLSVRKTAGTVLGITISYLIVVTVYPPRLF